MKVQHIYRLQNDGKNVPVTIYTDVDKSDGMPICGSIHGHYSAASMETLVNKLRAIDAAHER